TNRLRPLVSVIWHAIRSSSLATPSASLLVGGFCARDERPTSDCHEQPTAPPARRERGRFVFGSGLASGEGFNPSAERIPMTTSPDTPQPTPQADGWP